MIKSINERRPSMIEIDLTGPDGNAFVLLDYAKNLSKQLDISYEKVKSEMTSGDYENLLIVFDKYFGEYVILYR